MDQNNCSFNFVTVVDVKLLLVVLIKVVAIMIKKDVTNYFSNKLYVVIFFIIAQKVF